MKQADQIKQFLDEIEQQAQDGVNKILNTDTFHGAVVFEEQLTEALDIHSPEFLRET